MASRLFQYTFLIALAAHLTACEPESPVVVQQAEELDAKCLPSAGSSFEELIDVLSQIREKYVAYSPVNAMALYAARDLYTRCFNQAWLLLDKTSPQGQKIKLQDAALLGATTLQTSRGHHTAKSFYRLRDERLTLIPVYNFKFSLFTAGLDRSSSLKAVEALSQLELFGFELKAIDPVPRKSGNAYRVEDEAEAQRLFQQIHAKMLNSQSAILEIREKEPVLFQDLVPLHNQQIEELSHALITPASNRLLGHEVGGRQFLIQDHF